MKRRSLSRGFFMPSGYSDIVSGFIRGCWAASTGWSINSRVFSTTLPPPQTPSLSRTKRAGWGFFLRVFLMRIILGLVCGLSHGLSYPNGNLLGLGGLVIYFVFWMGYRLIGYASIYASLGTIFVIYFSLYIVFV